MKITQVRVSVLELSAPRRLFDLVTLAGMRHDRWVHAATPRPRGRPPSQGREKAAGPRAHQFVMHVLTNDGIEGVCTAESDGATRLTRDDVDQLRRGSLPCVRRWDRTSTLLGSISNTSYYEYFPGGWLDEVGKEIGMLNPPLPDKGFLQPPNAPGWGAEWDARQFKKRTVAEF